MKFTDKLEEALNEIAEAQQRHDYPPIAGPLEEYQERVYKDFCEFLMEGFRQWNDNWQTSPWAVDTTHGYEP